MHLFFFFFSMIIFILGLGLGVGIGLEMGGRGEGHLIVWGFIVRGTHWWCLSWGFLINIYLFTYVLW